MGKTIENSTSQKSLPPHPCMHVGIVVKRAASCQVYNKKMHLYFMVITRPVFESRRNTRDRSLRVHNEI